MKKLMHKLKNTSLNKVFFIYLKVIPSKYLDENTIYYINPSGKFIIGGPMGDAWLTGRKIIVDTYGGWGGHGGGTLLI